MDASTSTPGFDAVRIDARDTHDLRERVLRPGRPDECTYPGDDDEGTFHAGAIDDAGTVVAIASVYREPRPGTDPATTGDDGAWRLRGMAVEPALQRRGAGRAALDRCVDHVRSHGARVLWCNARTPAVPFYERQGWVITSDEFDIPGVGPHHVMELVLS